MPSVPSTDLLVRVRREAERQLPRSAAFGALPPERRRAIAHDTVRVLHFILGGSDRAARPASVALYGNARAFLVDAADRHPPRAGPAGLGGAADDFLAAVDFPAFVAGLLQGTFQAIVDASVRQMAAYAELLANVARSVDAFRDDNVSDGEARDYLLDRYPSDVELDASDGCLTLALRRGAGRPRRDFLRALGLGAADGPPPAPSVEPVLLAAARRRLAEDRQQLLATMVLMGVNRIGGTRGKVWASCRFALRVRRRAGAAA
jgi:hypothetical protein